MFGIYVIDCSRKRSTSKTVKSNSFIQPPLLFYLDILTIESIFYYGKKKNQFQNKADLRVVIGDKNAESYGLGDPCVPIELSYFQEQNSGSCVSQKKVVGIDDWVKEEF